MNRCKVDFESIPWQPGRPGVRQKVYCEGERTLRIVEFESSDGFEQWCDVGHIGYVLKGSLRIGFDGEEVAFRSGDGLFIPSGAEARHRAVWIEPGTMLLMIEGES